MVMFMTFFDKILFMSINKIFFYFYTVAFLYLSAHLGRCETETIEQGEIRQSLSKQVPLSMSIDSQYLDFQRDMVKGMRFNFKAVLLFSTNFSPFSLQNHPGMGVRVCTLSTYSHVALLLEDKAKQEEYCFESTQSHNKKFPGIGPQVQIRQAKVVFDEYPGRVWKRELFKDGEQIYPDVTEQVNKYLGKPFRTSPLEIFKLWCRTNTESNKECFFCIELVATVLQEHGYLSEQTLASNFVPWNFSKKHQKLALQGITLGDEIEITHPSRPRKSLCIRLLQSMSLLADGENALPKRS